MAEEMKRRLEASEKWDAASLEYARNCNPFCSLYAFDLLTSLLPVISSNSRCHFLDIGCGGGALELAYLRLFPEGSEGHQFTCTDLSGGMIEQTRQAVEAAKPATCKTTFHFRVDDATKLSTVDGDSIDVVVSAFAVFFIPARAAALFQISRVLREGGVFGMTAWTEVPKLPSGFGLVFEEVMFGSMKFLTPEQNLEKTAPEEESEGTWEDWRIADKGKKIISDAQFNGVKCWTSMHTAAFPSIKNIWNTITTSPMMDLSKASPEFINSAFQKFKESIKTKLGLEKEDVNDRMILLVNAANIFVGYK